MDPDGALLTPRTLARPGLIAVAIADPLPAIRSEPEIWASAAPKDVGVAGASASRASFGPTGRGRTDALPRPDTPGRFTRQMGDGRGCRFRNHCSVNSPQRAVGEPGARSGRRTSR